MRLSEALEDDYRDVKQMDAAYAQLDRLLRAMDKGDMGILIDKHGGHLDLNDIYKIRRELKDILHNNIFLTAGGNNNKTNGKDSIRLLGKRLGHGLELIGDELVGGMFISLSVASLSNPITGLIGAGVAASLAALSMASVAHQNHILKDLKVAATLIKVSELIDSSHVTTIPQRGMLRKILDKLERKTPEQIKNETKKKIEKASRKAEQKFERLTRKLPREIEYTNDHKVETISIEQLFSGL